jgi:hypothetical protein
VMADKMSRLMVSLSSRMPRSLAMNRTVSSNQLPRRAIIDTRRKFSVFHKIPTPHFM